MSFFLLELLVKWLLIISRFLKILCEEKRFGMVPHVVWDDTVVCSVTG